MKSLALIFLCLFYALPALGHGVLESAKNDSSRVVKKDYYDNGQLKSETVVHSGKIRYINLWTEDGRHLVKNGYGVFAYESKELGGYVFEEYEDSVMMYAWVERGLGEEVVYLIPEKEALPQRGYEWLYKQLNALIQYPLQTLDQQKGGKVTVRLQITKSGQMKRAGVIQSFDTKCTDEVFEALQQLNAKWQPAMHNGSPVDQFVSIPFYFHFPNVVDN